MKPRVLIVDDDKSQLEIYSRLAEQLQCHPFPISSPIEAIKILNMQNDDKKFDLVLLDIHMPNQSGLEVIKNIRPIHPDLPIIIMTAIYDGIDQVITAMKAGATDFLLKQQGIERAKVIMTDHLKKKLFQQELESITKTEYDFKQIVGKSKHIKNIVKLAKKISQNNCPVLVCGENGTGKELISKVIHYNSKRNHQYFNICYTKPSTDLNNLLFGHKKNYLKNTDYPIYGKLREAENSTLLIKNIENLTEDILNKLLLFLKNRKITISKNIYTVNTRVICTTNIGPYCYNNKLLEIFHSNIINILPLNSRIEDIKPLAKYFLQNFSKEHNKTYTISQKAIEMLQQYHWKNNIDELKEAIYKTASISTKTNLNEKDFTWLQHINNISKVDTISKKHRSK